MRRAKRNARLREERDALDRISGEVRQRAEKADGILKKIHGLVHGGILSDGDTVLKIHDQIHGR